MVVSSVTISMGMMMLPPVLISLPSSYSCSCFSMDGRWRSRQAARFRRRTLRRCGSVRVRDERTPEPASRNRDSTTAKCPTCGAVTLTQQAMLTARDCESLAGSSSAPAGPARPAAARPPRRCKTRPCCSINKLSDARCPGFCLPWLVQRDPAEYSEVLIATFRGIIVRICQLPNPGMYQCGICHRLVIRH